VAETNQNPLQSSERLPEFNQVKPEHIVPAISEEIASANKTIQSLEKLAETDQPNWDNFAAVLENIELRIDHAWSTVSHLNSVMDSDELRQAYQEGKQLLTAFHTELGQNLTLFKAFKNIQASDQFNTLNKAQQRIITNAVRDFTLSGAELSESKKLRFAEISQELTKLSTKFEQNLLDATQAWHLLITDEAELAGLPEYAVEMGLAAAKRNDQQGWRFGLDHPSFLAIMRFADSGNVRKQMYKAFVTRASELTHFSDTKKNEDLDNNPVIDQILSLRDEKAALLGFGNYAELALTTKMANTAEEVIEFLNKIAKHAKPKAKQELEELNAFAKEYYGVEQLHAWDNSYYSEKLKEQVYHLDSEEIKRYFPVEKVISGLFTICNRLFDIQIVANNKNETWHEDVLSFDVLDNNNQLIGQLFADLYARENKRSGAWMGVCRHRQQTADNQSLPVAYLTCNFTPDLSLRCST